MIARDRKTGRFVSAEPLEASPALTAAVLNVPVGTLERMTPAGAEAWQSKAWRLWREVGVLHYPTSFKAQQTARVNWDVKVDGVALEEDAADAVVEAVTSPMGPVEATRRLALNLEVAGEAWYLRRSEEWTVASPASERFREVTKGADIAVKAWLADPVDPQRPDSPVRAALPVAEEIRVLQALSRSQSRNRTSQRGLLLYPSEGVFPDGFDFEGTLEKTMTAPIADEYSSSAVVPPIIKFPGERIEQWRHLSLDHPYDEHLDRRMDNAIRRLALSLQIPPEILLGLADVNHWNAWLAEEQMYRAHVEPLATLVGSVFSEAASRATDKTVKITADPIELLARRQSVADAFRAYELGLVNPAYVRRVIGAQDDDAPTDEELATLLVVLRGATSVSSPSLGTGQTNVGPPSGNGAAVNEEV